MMKKPTPSEYVDDAALGAVDALCHALIERLVPAIREHARDPDERALKMALCESFALLGARVDDLARRLDRLERQSPTLAGGGGRGRRLLRRKAGRRP